MNILGISAFYHDSAAALVRDGEIIAAAQEERFTRRKHDPSFPKHAVAYCLREAKISRRELDAVVFYEKPFVKAERLLETYLGVAPRGLRSFTLAIPTWLREKNNIPAIIRRELGKEYEGPALFTEHHESHGIQGQFGRVQSDGAGAVRRAESCAKDRSSACGFNLRRATLAAAWARRSPSGIR